jgi:hypothetical protein
MFAPETAGIVSRLASNQTEYLTRYRILVPFTWFIEYNEDSRFSAMTAPGIGRIGFRRYWRREVPVSEMGFYAVAHPEEYLTKNVPLDDDIILEKRSFSLGSESLNCWDLIEKNKFVGPRPSDPSIALIRCSSDSEHIYAYFDGWRGDTAAFYDTLRGLNGTR